MVISLREDYFKGDSVTWDEVKNLGLKSWDPRLEINGKRASSTSPKLQQTNSFSQLVTRLRNAFAHNCFDLIMAEDKDLITGITVWNIPTGKTNQLNRIWEADILESELKGLAYLFVEYLEKVFDL